jgi:hypothetical protein
MMITKESAIFIMPAGILVGIPFPLGITVVGSSSLALIPWAWAVNGCFSVIAPILAAMLALSAGYQFVLLISAVTYLLAFWLIRQGPDGSGEPRIKFGSARTSDDEAKVTV